MSGYSSAEQAIGGILDRFPRLKAVAETVYQRASYHVLADTTFEYELHDEVTMQSVASWAGVDDHSEQFVGFYDVSPWNESMSKYFVHELKGDEVTIRVYGEGEVETVARTTAWNYQQGSRTQWHPTRNETLVFNDVAEGTAVAKLVDTTGDIRETYDRPVQAVSPTGEEFASVSYRRLDRNSPGYGYGLDDESSLPDPTADGLFRVDFETPDEAELVVPFSELIADAGTTVSQDAHYIHHVLYSPSGDRVVFLHRWIVDGKRHTQLCYVDERDEWRVVLENPYLSHFCWLDDEHLFLWGGSDKFGRGYHVVDVTSGELSYIDALAGFGDGHPSVSPDGQWIVTDSYPDRVRKRSLTLYNLDTGEVVSLGEFFAPFGYDGQQRCDLHPRWSPDGRFVSVDSAHEGMRRSHVLEIDNLRSE